jgi:hypothetical protein
MFHQTYIFWKLLPITAGVAGLEDSFENWQKTIEVDLLAAMRLTDLCLPHIISNIGAGTGACKLFTLLVIL